MPWRVATRPPSVRLWSVILLGLAIGKETMSDTRVGCQEFASKAIVGKPEGTSIMPVFISHRTADDQVAQGVYRKLHYSHGIECYIDDFDNEVSNTERITSRIVERLNRCTHLLAIITDNTRGSWWVPFEIGVARQAPRFITSYTSYFFNGLPEYLREWPVLNEPSAVDIFARMYKERKFKASYVLSEAYSLRDRLAEVDSFHSSLKRALRQ